MSGALVAEIVALTKLLISEIATNAAAMAEIRAHLDAPQSVGADMATKIAARRVARLKRASSRRRRAALTGGEQ